MCDCKGVGLFQSCPSRGMQPLPVNFTLQRVPTTKWLYFGKMCTLPIDSGLFEAHRTCLGPCKIGQNTHPSYMTFSGNHLLDTNRTCKICACRFSQFAASHANTCAASNIISSLSSATRATSGGMLPKLGQGRQMLDRRQLLSVAGLMLRGQNADGSDNLHRQPWRWP